MAAALSLCSPRPARGTLGLAWSCSEGASQASSPVPKCNSSSKPLELGGQDRWLCLVFVVVVCCWWGFVAVVLLFFFFFVLFLHNEEEGEGQISKCKKCVAWIMRKICLLTSALPQIYHIVLAQPLTFCLSQHFLTISRQLQSSTAGKWCKMF